MPHAVQTPTTNLILYGPPGTGKTYQTAWEAVRLCLDDDVADKLTGEENRKQLMVEYQRLMSEGRIEFVTFHQSMSYEEFVEGLRPSTADTGETSGGFSLEPVDGVFKRISAQALAGATQPKPDDRLKLEGRSVYKMSLGATYLPEEAPIFDDAVSENCIIFGFYGIDFSDEKFADRAEIDKVARERFQSGTGIEPSAAATMMTDLFRNKIKKGDIIIASKGNLLVRSIARVTGEYEFQEREGTMDYCHRRSVEWLWTSADGLNVHDFYDDRFVQRTLYSLNTSRLKGSAVERFMNTQSRTSETRPESHVLIIDEINRANISKVFGELITLLEADKRLGRRDEIQLTLPYSKKRFGVPANLHIIGTMNTADRSIALLDTALRRRFTFRELMPNPSVLSPNVGGINLQGTSIFDSFCGHAAPQVA
jgi:5-methylcytosine-specific restriction protein B